VRYPEIDLPLAARDADLALLSSEPYPFREKDRERVAQALSADSALAARRVALIDGEMVSWYGSRAVRGLAYLRDLRQAFGKSAGT
jgi:hypothetical protein